METVKLGAKVRDTITGLEGIVIHKTEWLNGCWRIGVQPQELKDGKPVEYSVFDVEQLELVAESKAPVPVRTGGDRDSAVQRSSAQQR